MNTYKHKIPIHLETADHIILGLTTRQLLLIGAGMAIGYTIWSDLSFLNASNWGMVLNGLVSLVPAFLGLAAAFLQPAARGLEQWLLVAMFYVLTPKCYMWTLLPYEQQQHEQENLQAVSIEDEEDE